jgi:hypothetical protein
MHTQSHDDHVIPRKPFNPYSSKGQKIAADAAEGRMHDKSNNLTSTTGSVGHTGVQHADLLPGSHPYAQNPEAVPTAGGQRVGSIGGTGIYNEPTHTTGHGHGNHGQGSHLAAAGVGAGAAGQHGTHDQYGSYPAADNRTTTEKIKDKIIPSRSDRPDDMATGQNYSQSGTHNVAPGAQNTHPTSHLDRQHVGSGVSHGDSAIPGTGHNTSYGSGVQHDSGVGNITHGVSTLSSGSTATGGLHNPASSNHNKTDPSVALKGKLGGAYEAGYRDAVEQLQEKK